MAEAASRSCASVFYIGLKPNVVSAMLKRICGAWAESLATNQPWRAEKKRSAQGDAMGSPLTSVLFLFEKESFLDAKALERGLFGGDDSIGIQLFL